MPALSSPPARSPALVRLPFDPEPYTRDDIRVERHRVGGPDLFTLPSRHVPLPDDHPLTKAMFRDGAAQTIRMILEEEEIQFFSLQVNYLSSLEDPRSYVEFPPTITIEARWEATDERAWRACERIRQLLQLRGFEDDVVIEIVDPAARQPTPTLAVLASDDVVGRCAFLAPSIVAIARTVGASAVELLRRQKNVEDEPLLTVVVTMPPSSTASLSAARDRIAHILDENGLAHVNVEVVSGWVWKSRLLGKGAQPTILPQRSYEVPANASVSLGRCQEFTARVEGMAPTEGSFSAEAQNLPLLESDEDGDDEDGDDEESEEEGDEEGVEEDDDEEGDYVKVAPDEDEGEE
ncbi:MAG: hypothetical protein M1826_005044 [Phylliscum demangeonii]|nr:MAG: hypothetical protein M1826_005044 [Phylliscum demangeonii]